ncbi:MAG: hypothetical protein QCH99_11420 [Candidatus Bathyarchaeota archaeon]|nr:hypothetical protein [Candidatus Bathyarchaeum tardum]
MLDKNTHNLMMRLIEEKRSLLRIETSYNRHNKSDQEHQNFINILKRMKEEQIKDLEQRLGKKSNRNLEITPPKNVKALLTDQGYSSKSIETLSKWYDLSM